MALIELIFVDAYPTHQMPSKMMGRAHRNIILRFLKILCQDFFSLTRTLRLLDVFALLVLAEVTGAPFPALVVGGEVVQVAVTPWQKSWHR